MLEEFWAVTKTSLYHVLAKDEPSPYPVAVKVALRGWSQIAPGAKLEGETMIAICKSILMFFPEKYSLSNPLTGPDEREPAHINIEYWGPQTSHIVALFLSEEGARNCFEQEHLKDRDPRWLEQTKEVLKANGDDHPAFVISHSKEMALIPEEIRPLV